MLLADAADGPRGTIVGGMGRIAGGAQGQRPAGLLRARRAASRHGPRAPQSQPHRHGDRGQALRGGARGVGPGAPPRCAVRRDLVRLRRGGRRVHGGRGRRARRHRRRLGRDVRGDGLPGDGRHGRRAGLSAQGLPQGRAGEWRRGLDRGHAAVLARGARRRRGDRPSRGASPWRRCSRTWPSASPPRRSFSTRPARSCCRVAWLACPSCAAVSSEALQRFAPVHVVEGYAQGLQRGGAGSRAPGSGLGRRRRAGPSRRCHGPAQRARQCAGSSVRQ